MFERSSVGEAEEEYAVAATNYAHVSPELGRRFHDEIERLISEICRRPKLYRFVQSPIRRHLSTTYPFGILYEDTPDHVRILAVIPLRRDPDYWLHRAND